MAAHPPPKPTEGRGENRQWKHVCVYCAAVSVGIMPAADHSCGFMVIAAGPITGLISKNEVITLWLQALFGLLAIRGRDVVRALKGTMSNPTGTIPMALRAPPKK